MPITPAPSTIIDRGIRGRRRMLALSKTVSASKSTSAGWFGLDPVAMTITPPRSSQRFAVRPRSTATVCGSTKRPCPRSSSTPYFRSARWISSSSRWTTIRSRCMKSPMVISPSTSQRMASSLARVTPCTNSALSRSVLLGMAPQFTPVPPTSVKRSTSAVRLPARAAWMAARSPAGPPPITITSNSDMGPPGGRRATRPDSSGQPHGASPQQAEPDTEQHENRRRPHHGQRPVPERDDPVQALHGPEGGEGVRDGARPPAA